MNEETNNDIDLKECGSPFQIAKKPGILTSFSHLSEKDNISIKSSIPHGPPRHPTLNAYAMGNGEHIKFKTWKEIPRGDIVPNDVRYDKAYELVEQTAQSDSNTERWDDRWYWESTSVGTCIVMVAVVLETLDYSWVIIINDPAKWYYLYTNLGNRSPVPSGGLSNGSEYQIKKSIRFGQNTVVDFDFYNPRNEGGFDANDIVLGWGY